VSKITNFKHQITNKSQISKRFKAIVFLFGILNFGHCYLPFDLTQGGEFIEPFVFWDLLFEISIRQ